MKPATKLFTKAIIWEFVLAVITFNIINYSDRILPFLLANGVLLGFFLLGCVPLIPLVYWLGEKLNWQKIKPYLRIFYGIWLQFLFLIILFTFPLFCFIIKELHDFFDSWIKTATILFTAGGIQTLIIGIWLGIKLSKIKDNSLKINQL